MNTTPLIVSLTDAWGPKYGGINAFNVELMRSMGIQPWRAFDVCNLVLNATDEDRADAERHHVELIDLNVSDRRFPSDTAGKVASTLAPRSQNRLCIWLAHDTVSGALALQLRGLVANSRAVIIHHMAFGAYQDFKKGSSHKAAEKREMQRALFKQADLCFAVGPMLRDQLADLLSGEPNPPAIEMLVPGLAEPDPERVEISDSPPHNFMAFVAGRLGAEDDRIKQGALSVRAFGRAAKSAFQDDHADQAIRRSPTLRMRGVPDDGQDEIRQLLREASGRELNCDLGEYTEDRAAYFRDLATSSVAMMLSWHEGFGLAAWEAIACQVPVVIGEESGVYRLLNNDCQGMGLKKSVRRVAVAGYVGNDEAFNHTDDDVNNVANALLDLGGNIGEVKKNAVELADILRRLDYTWKGCVATLADAMEKHLAVQLRQEPSSAQSQIPAASELPQPPSATAAIPSFLRPPVARPWRADVGQAPSALLVAQDKIVRFHHERDMVVNDLLRWADDCETRIGLRVLSGPGGMGKTRTALEALSRADGWQQLWLSAKLPEDWIVEWQRWLEANNGARVWLVIDYADAQQDVLLRLLDVVLECIQHSAGPAALRALMLTRNVTWWHQLAHRSDCTKDVAALIGGSANGGIEELPPWKNDPDVRVTTYRAALEDYAAAQGRAVPKYAYLPDFSAPAFARPLFLHLAALAALEGERPSHADSLLTSQLDREWRYWQMRHPGLTCYDDWADALAWLGLVQGANIAHAEAAFADLGIARLARAFADTYPGEKDTIASLQPDLLVEALLRKRLTGTRGARLLNRALTNNAAASLAVIARLAAGIDPHGLQDAQPPLWQIALRDGLATAWPIHGQALIHAAHFADIGLAHLLLQAWKILPEEAQGRIAPALSLPNYSTPLIALSTAIDRASLRAASSEARRAAALSNLGVRLSNQGDVASRTEALACAREAMKIYRKLAQAQPSAYLPDLAGLQNNLATFLCKQGDAASRTEALVCAREAVKIYREQAQAQPSAYLPYLAASLNNLATFLSEQGDAASRTEALVCAREAVGIYALFYAQMPTAYENNLGIAVIALSRAAQAIGLDAEAEFEKAIRAMMSGEREGDGR